MWYLIVSIPDLCNLITLVRIRAKIEKNTLFGRVLVRIRAQIVKNTLFGRALFRIKANIEKTPFVAGLWFK